MDLVRRGVLVVVQQPVEDDEAGGTDTSSSRRLPREIFILGTTHVSETAAEDAMRVVRSVQPQNVVVELCKSRAPIMYDPVPDPSQPSAPNSDVMGAAASGAAAAPAPARDLFLMGGASLTQTLMRSIQLGGQSSLLLRLLLSFVSRRSAQAVGVQPGHEFRAAREAADAIGAQLVLGDRPIEITLRRAWKALSLLDRARLASALLQGGLKGGSLEQSELKGAFSRQRDSSNGQGMESLNMDRDVVGSGGVVEKDDAEGEEEVEFLSAVFQEVARQFPTLLGPLVHERDAAGREECSNEEACIEDRYNEDGQDANDCQVAGNYWTRRGVIAGTGSGLAAVALAIVTTGAFTVPIANAATAAAPAPTAAGAALDTASWKLLESAFGFSFLYPSSYIVTINRKNDPADAPLTADGAQALAVVGNFVTFDTMSVIRYAFTPNPDKLAPLIQRILPNGNLRTSLVEDTVFPNQPIIELPLDLQKILSALASPAGLSFDVVTETCRGRIEEGKGGVGECVSVRGADLVQPIVRRHIGRILLSEGYLYVITESCTEARWTRMKAQLL
ncbi:unnamed protein product [Closterium sp. Naga37s-1]|nr:unnamed protein product [Closterium sp. Naga37s-1]